MLTGCDLDSILGGDDSPKDDTKTYNIQYSLDGGSLDEDAPKKYQAKDLPIILPIPTKEGYTFMGWYQKNDFSGDQVVILGKGTTGNIIFYAKWQKDETNGVYEITYELYGGTLDNPIKTFKKEFLPITLLTPIKTGYRFIGWYLDPEFTILVTKIIEAKDVTVYAKWEKIEQDVNVYNIIYHLNGGINHLNNPDKLYESELPFTLFKPTRVGYIFVGWYITNEFEGEEIKIIDTLDGDLNLYAKWEKEPEAKYNISYVLNGGTNHPDNPIKYTQSVLPIAIKNPTRDGYIFTGWYLTSDFSGSKVTGLTKDVIGNIILYAKWEPVTDQAVEMLLEIAEHSRLQSDLDLAKAAILVLPEGSQKQELLQRLNNIEIIEDDVIRDDSTIID